MNDIDALLKLEARRCAAIGSGDGAALETMLSDDYTHVHGAGNIDDRQGFIHGILSHPRTVRRGKISVRLYGEVAILLGEQVNQRGGTETSGILQQIAARGSAGWRFVAAQMTFKSRGVGAQPPHDLGPFLI
jgi:hypothetical protein